MPCPGKGLLSIKSPLRRCLWQLSCGRLSNQKPESPSATKLENPNGKQSAEVITFLFSHQPTNVPVLITPGSRVWELLLYTSLSCHQNGECVWLKNSRRRYLGKGHRAAARPGGQPGVESKMWSCSAEHVQGVPSGSRLLGLRELTRLLDLAEKHGQVAGVYNCRHLKSGERWSKARTSLGCGRAWKTYPCVQSLYRRLRRFPMAVPFLQQFSCDEACKKPSAQAREMLLRLRILLLTVDLLVGSMPGAVVRAKTAPMKPLMTRPCGSRLQTSS